MSLVLHQIDCRLCLCVQWKIYTHLVSPEELILIEAKIGQFLAYSGAHTRSDMTVSDFQLENIYLLLLLSKWQATGLLTLLRQIRVVYQITNHDLTGHTVICK